MHIRTNDIDLYYEVRGNGKPLILLHGNGEDHTVFGGLAAALADNFTVYAMDSRCHGQSGFGELHYADMAEDVAAFIRALGLHRPVVCGFSDGGIVALLLAVRHPGLASALVAAGANTHPKGLKWHWRLAMRAEYLLKLCRDAKLRLMLAEPDISSEELNGIGIPVLVVAGERDMIDERHTRALSAALPRGTLKILPGETHDSYIKKHKVFLRVLTSFFEKTEEW